MITFLLHQQLEFKVHETIHTIALLMKEPLKCVLEGLGRFSFYSSSIFALNHVTDNCLVICSLFNGTSHHCTMLQLNVLSR